MVNSWVTHCFANENTLTLLDFKRSITKAYLQLFSDSDPKNSGQPKVFSSKVIPEIRFSTIGHILD